MVAKIGHGENIRGALSYNQLKVQKENGEILFTHKMVETPDGNYCVAQLAPSFEPYLLANRRTEKSVLHVSLNPDPRDKVSGEDFKEMAQQYMQRMGYGNQPFVVFKHTDIERTHIHIVSVCVDEEGRKVSDAFERLRPIDICRWLEQQYNLIPAANQNRKQDDKIFQPVDYRAGDIKSQIASVVRHLPKYHQFQSFGGYNALLSLFNITAEEVKGELDGKPKEGVVYFALNEQGEKVSNPFKASLFGKTAGYVLLQDHYERAKENLKTSHAKKSLRSVIGDAFENSVNEVAFRQLLLDKGINIVVRRNSEGRIYGIAFIDHTSKTVWNGSQLSKELSANAFQDRWSNSTKAEVNSDQVKSSPLQPGSGEQVKGQTDDLFNFLPKKGSRPDDNNIMQALGFMMPDVSGTDYEEELFVNKIKKRKKRKNKSK